MSWRRTRKAADRSASAWQARPDALIALVSRLLLAQAGATAAVSLSFSRRNVPSILLVIGVAAVLCALAGLVRSGSHLAWLTTVTFECCFVAIGLFQFAIAPYLGGTLLGIGTLGTMLHPSVAARFASAPGELAGPEAADGSAELMAGQAIS